jgi:hypothetical protein
MEKGNVKFHMTSHSSVNQKHDDSTSLMPEIERASQS